MSFAGYQITKPFSHRWFMTAVNFSVYVLLIVVCPFVLFLLAIVLSVLLRYTDSDCLLAKRKSTKGQTTFNKTYI